MVQLETGPLPAGQIRLCTTSLFVTEQLGPQEP